MVRGENTHCALCDIEVIHTLLHIRADVADGEHNALTLTGCTRGKYDGGYLVNVDFIVVIGVIASLILFSTCCANVLNIASALKLGAAPAYEGMKGGNKLAKLLYLLIDSCGINDVLALCGIKDRSRTPSGKPSEAI